MIFQIFNFSLKKSGHLLKKSCFFNISRRNLTFTPQLENYIRTYFYNYYSTSKIFDLKTSFFHLETIILPSLIQIRLLFPVHEQSIATILLV